MTGEREKLKVVSSRLEVERKGEMWATEKKAESSGLKPSSLGPG
jgi:hypothetical protein